MKKQPIVWAGGSLAALMTAGLLAGQWLASDAMAQVTYPAGTPATHDTVVDNRDTTLEHREHMKVCKASDLIGMNVRSRQGDDNIGSINDLVIDDNDGRIKYVAVSFGGFLGMGDKMFAVPMEALEFTKTDDDAYARIDVTEETLKDKQGFNQDNWPTEANERFLTGVERVGRSNDVAR